MANQLIIAGQPVRSRFSGDGKIRFLQNNARGNRQLGGAYCYRGLKTD